MLIVEMTTQENKYFQKKYTASQAPFIDIVCKTSNKMAKKINVLQKAGTEKMKILGYQNYLYIFALDFLGTF